MFGIGTGELLLIFLIALFVFGPERLPGLARDVGKAMAELRKASDEITDEFLKADEPRPTPEPPAIPATTAELPQAATPESSEGQEETEFDRKAQADADRAREEARLRGETPAAPSEPPPPEPERWG